MKFSRVQAQLKRHEGRRLTVYRCSAGKLTIGFGRNLEDKGISLEEANIFLITDITETAFALLDVKPVYSTLDHVRQETLVNMAYQLGVSGCLGFVRMWTAIEQRDYQLAAREMLDSKWFREDTPSRALELSEQMRTGVYAVGGDE